MKTRLFMFCVGAFLTLAGFDCGPGGSGAETKREACIRLGQAYCDRELVVGCADLTDPCVSDDCMEIDAACEATSEEIGNVDQAIVGTIGAAADCDDLRSKDNMLISMVYDMASRSCANAGDYDTRGEMCAELVGAYCDKNLELSCYNLTKPECMELVYSWQLMNIGNYKCTGGDDDDAPSPLNLGYFREAMAEIDAARTCP